MTIPDWQSRTGLLLGKEAVRKLNNSNILVVGLGGVGAYTTEMLCRAGIGRLTIADGDTVHSSNINRQLIATKNSLGAQKAEVMANRLSEINPGIELNVKAEFLQKENMGALMEISYDYVVDAIDTLSPKVSLITEAIKKAYPLVSSMGAGGKTDPLQVKAVDISETYNCRLAYSLRKALHRHGIRTGFKVVFSPEKVSKESIQLTDNEQFKRSVVGTVSYMPAIFGCIMASVVIRDLIK